MYHSLRRAIRRIIVFFLRPVHRLLEEIADDELPRFANAPKNLKIERPRRIFDAERITIGDDVLIGPGSMLIPQTHYPTAVMQNPDNLRPVRRYEPKIVIGNRVTATGGLTLSALESITIEDDVMFAGNVFVMDGQHGFDHVDEPYKYQPMCRIAPILIKRGCWIGQNVVIMPGVTIGELSIVGANSVVTRSIPPRCIAVGAPAKVIKKWDAAQEKWIAVD